MLQGGLSSLFYYLYNMNMQSVATVLAVLNGVHRCSRRLASWSPSWPAGIALFEDVAITCVTRVRNHVYISMKRQMNLAHLLFAQLIIKGGRSLGVSIFQRHRSLRQNT